MQLLMQAKLMTTRFLLSSHVRIDDRRVKYSVGIYRLYMRCFRLLLSVYYNNITARHIFALISPLDFFLPPSVPFRSMMLEFYSAA